MTGALPPALEAGLTDITDATDLIDLIDPRIAMNLLHEDLARAQIQARLEDGRAHRQAAEARRARRTRRLRDRGGERGKLVLHTLLVRMLGRSRVGAVKRRLPT